MENIIKTTTTLRSSTRNMTIVCIASLVIAGAVAVGSVAFSLSSSREASRDIYILDKGEVSTATRSESPSENRTLEVYDHVVRFHELFYNLSPSSEAITASIDKALIMSDKSAYNYWRDLSEKGFYSRLVSANISQNISIDSVKTDISSYPYRAAAFFKLYVIRESNITAYSMVTTCQLVDVKRSKTNPHGLMIEQFAVQSNENLGTRKRK